MDILPISSTLGAVVAYIDARSLTADGFAEPEATWHEQVVLIFPDQDLDYDALIAFSYRLGSLERLQTTAVEGAQPEIFMASNVNPDGHINPVSSALAVHIIYSKHNRIWHVDSSFKSTSTKTSLLRAETVLAAEDQSDNDWVLKLLNDNANKQKGT